ncbi:sulfatase family protein [Pontiella sulfatireligans]|uniref:Arylsulfatase n=1 Tax=Pontiella sulfatireligans TaxID=2750658 RepID=A0A6C2UEI7_9BACT|nr:sulfatase [Pontiella sulfatireligans]SPS74179.1 sulfatase S1_25 [Kiritimatiellales bacterium]VGO18528.1 Arylsulfatase [Pontiella sulfatireligans]
MRKKYLITIASAVACLILDSVADDRPNIVYLMSDDHQATAMGCMGNSEIETPNLDKLASRGVLFERCYATTPLCMPSRATTMLGMYEYKTGCNFLTGKVSLSNWKNSSYPMLLKKAGYRTAFAGKWGFNLEGEVSAQTSAKDDFDVWGGLQGSQGNYLTEKNKAMKAYAKEYPHVTRALGAFGRDFIVDSAKQDQPFCLSISFKAPHAPYNVIDPEDQKKYAGVRFSEPAGFDQEGWDNLAIQPKLGRQYMQRDRWDKDHYQDHLRVYYQLISGVDSAVGMVVKALEEAGVADNTVIIYTADNGYFCGAHGLQGKALPYEQATHIPLIIYDPRTPKAARGRKTPAIAANIDFAPTMLDLAGVPVPAQMDGKSLVPSIQNPDHRVRTQLGLVQNWDVLNRDMPKALAVVSEDWKYIHWCYADENVPVCEQLFDLKRDPNEMNNVAQSPEKSAILKSMQKHYDAFHQQWVEGCVDGPHYKRYATIFDRNIPWQKKDYRVDIGRGDTSQLTEKEQKFHALILDMFGEQTIQTYTEQTGAAYPVEGKR